MKQKKRIDPSLPGYIRAREVTRIENRRNKIKKYTTNIIIIIFLAVLIFNCTPYGKYVAKELWIWSKADPIYSAAADSPFNIHFLNVGNADSVLIECDDEAMLLDGATEDMGEAISDYLYFHDIEALKYVVASHPDSDHTGGLKRVISEHDVSAFMYGKMSAEVREESVLFDDLLECAADLNIERRMLYTGEKFNLGSAQIEVLSFGEQYDESNNASLVLKVIYKDFSAIFCGDIENKAEEDLFYSEADLSADLIKISHHGSKTSSQKRFLIKVDPKYAVISSDSSKGNFPSRTVTDRINRLGVETYITETDGNILFSVNGDSVNIVTEFP